MKKVLFIAVVAVASLASCKKDRVCTCTETQTYTGSSTTYPSSTTVTTYDKAKKGDARAACLSGTTTYTGGQTVRDCSLN